MAFGLCPVCWGDQDRPEDRAAISRLIDEFRRAFNAGDAKSLGALFTDDALLIEEAGKRTRGRPAVESQFAGVFAEDPGRSISIRSEELRFIGPDTAIEEGTATLTPGKSGGDQESTRYVVIYARRDGKWFQAEIRDLAQDLGEAHEKLQSLAWLLGDWVSEGPEGFVEIRTRWDENRKFLLRDFDVKVAGRPALSGTQRIGWDAAAKQFRCWAFDSEGGFAEGTILPEGDGWVMQLSGSRPDGQRATATHLITRLDMHRIHWEALDRTIGGRASDRLESFTLVRRPPGVKSSQRTTGDPSAEAKP
jgi:uncharacterized protein (TIGR02246 family)